MKYKITLLATLLVTACAGGMQPIDAKKTLAEMGGPKIATVEDSLKESAKKAEEQGNFKQAAIFYQQLLEKAPGNADIALSLADSLRRSGNYDRAILLYDKLIEKDAGAAAPKEGKALALIAQGDFDSPAVLLEDVMKLDASRWKTLNALGILFSTRNMQPEAEQYFTEALKNHPDNPTVLNNLGLAQALGRHFDLAIESLQKASRKANTATNERKRIDLNMALVYASAKKLAEARALAEQYLTGAELNNNLGLYAHLANDDKMARAYLNMALTESKTYYARAWDNLQDISKDGNDNPTGETHPKPAARKPAVPQMALPPDLFPGSDAPATE